MALKHVTQGNWRSTDPTWDAFLISSVEDDPDAAWASLALSVELGPTVPGHLRELFTVACSTLVYARLFYPLLTVGDEQILRVMEAAVTEKCQIVHAPAKRFADRLKWLELHDLISPEQAFRWHNIRRLRNEASHLRSQSIYPPGEALTMRDIAAELINDLFR